MMSSAGEGATPPRPLEGVRVLEVAIYGFVPSAGAILAEWGAEVLKIEHVAGEAMRSNNIAGVGKALFLWHLCNRGKKALTLDLADAEGLEIALRLAETADVFLTNFLPPARRRLGIDVDDIRARNPRIIYGRGTGQGSRGPDAEKGGFDKLSYWYRTGMADSTTPPGANDPALIPGNAFGDLTSGMALAGGIAAALLGRQRTGNGMVVDCSLLASGMWGLSANIAASSMLGVSRLEAPDRLEFPNPLMNTYRTSDGRFIALCMIESDRYWPGLCVALGAEELAHDPRFATAAHRSANAAACVKTLDELVAKRTCAEMVELLEGQEGQWSLVQTVGEVQQDPQVLANGYLQRRRQPDGTTLGLVANPVQFDEQPVDIPAAPAKGEHTDQVLGELGLTPDELADLRSRSVI
jgi:crotonobetainyl-CoA:carnitine CoA-transferase CaiB-like acyl-CoA transferase